MVLLTHWGAHLRSCLLCLFLITQLGCKRFLFAFKLLERPVAPLRSYGQWTAVCRYARHQPLRVWFGFFFFTCFRDLRKRRYIFQKGNSGTCQQHTAWSDSVWCQGLIAFLSLAKGGRIIIAFFPHVIVISFFICIVFWLCVCLTGVLAACTCCCTVSDDSLTSFGRH